MDLKPFIRLPTPRAASWLELPPDLAEFYTTHEGVGLESDLDRTVRLCRLDEVERVAWKDLRSITADEVPAGWEEFAAFRIGMGLFFEEIVYVLSAPSCLSGSILEIGGVAPGPGGEGPFSLESTLILAASFRDWLAHLERWEWVEYAMIGVGDLPEQQRQELIRHYLSLNPGMNVGRPESGETPPARIS